MRIGQFASQNNLSIDAIRHYMDMDLIMPLKRGGQYDFDDRCQKDLEDILGFKELGFTLQEIKSIFLFKRLGNLTPYQEDTTYKEFFNNKYKEIAKQIDDLLLAKTNLERKIKDLDLKPFHENFKMGIDIGALGLFKCLSCESSLTLFDAQVSDNQIIHGKLRCKCSQEYLIHDGIMMIDNNIDLSESKSSYGYLMEYINVTNPEYLSNMYGGLEWSYKKFNFEEMKGKVALELGSGLGFLLRHIYADLPDDLIYIAVDHNIERHRFLKNMLERTNCKKKILFICADFLSIPIRNRSVDMVLDYSGTSNYSFEHEECLLKLVNHYVKEEAYLFGGYILFKNFRMDSFISKTHRKNFILDNIKKEIQELRYKILDERVSNFLQEGGIYENYFKKGEKVYSCMIYAKR